MLVYLCFVLIDLSYQTNIFISKCQNIFVHIFKGSIYLGGVMLKYVYFKEKHEIFVIIKEGEIVKFKDK